jgi:hypothetical protein
MLKNISQLECKVNDKIYHFTCDMDAPLHEVKEAIFQFQLYVGRIEEAVKAKQTEEQSKVENIEEDVSKEQQVG